MADLRYGRVLIKLSGEALAGDNKFGIESDKAVKIGAELGE